MSRLPVVDQTAWVNAGNRPERVNAKATNLRKSQQASVGGRGMNRLAPGMAALMCAPRPHKDGPLYAEETPQDTPAARPVASKPLKARKCPNCTVAFARWETFEAHYKACVPLSKVGKSKPTHNYLAPPRPQICPLCGLMCASRNARGLHQYGCCKEGAD